MNVILMVLAVLFLALQAFGVSGGKVSFGWGGLALWAATSLTGLIP